MGLPILGQSGQGSTAIIQAIAAVTLDPGKMYYHVKGNTTTTAAFDITLPHPSGVPDGAIFIFENLDSNAQTLGLVAVDWTNQTALEALDLNADADIFIGMKLGAEMVTIRNGIA